MTAERSEAISSYRTRHLAIRRISEIYGGGPTYTSSYYHSYGGWGFGSVHVMGSPFYRLDTWAVFQGPERLSVPVYLDKVGDTARLQDLEKRVRSNRTASTSLFVLGGAGVATSLVGLIGVDSATTEEQYLAWSAVSTSGVLAMVVGFVGGSFPASKARKLQYSAPHTLTLEEVEAAVRGYNGALREELGLSPADALRAEERQPRD